MVRRAHLISGTMLFGLGATPAFAQTAPVDTFQLSSETIRDRERDEVAGWMEISSGYGLEELRRYSDTDGQVIRDTFEDSDSLYWSIAGGIDWKRRLRKQDTLALSGNLRTTRYEIAKRDHRTDFNFDASLLHAIGVGSFDIRPGIRVEEQRRDNVRSKTRLIAYGTGRIALVPEVKVAATAGLRRIEDHATNIAGNGRDIRLVASGTPGSNLQMQLRARHYRENWALTTASFAQDTLGFGFDWRMRSNFEAKFSGFAAQRRYGTDVGSSEIAIRDTQVGCNFDLRLRASSIWLVEIGTSVKHRKSNLHGRDRKDQLLALSVRRNI